MFSLDNSGICVGNGYKVKLYRRLVKNILRKISVEQSKLWFKNTTRSLYNLQVQENIVELRFTDGP